MDRNEIINNIVNSELQREQSELIYEILKLEIEANKTSINIFGNDDYLFYKGIELGIKKCRELIEKRYNNEKN